MTKANALRKFFKKLFNVDLEGNSTTQVLANAIDADISASGGGGSTLVIHKIEDPLSAYVRLDKTFREIYDAFVGGTLCVIVDNVYEDDNWTISGGDAVISVEYEISKTGQYDSKYDVKDVTNTWMADSMDGYPGVYFD